jgi:hypothetical protein
MFGKESVRSSFPVISFIWLFIKVQMTVARSGQFSQPCLPHKAASSLIVQMNHAFPQADTKIYRFPDSYKVAEK